MTANTYGSPPGDEPTLTFSGEFLDALIEAVIRPPDPRARSAVICSLVLEMCASVEWLGAGDTGLGRATDEELTSVRRLASAAHDHRLRMSSGFDAPGGLA